MRARRCWSTASIAISDENDVHQALGEATKVRSVYYGWYIVAIALLANMLVTGATYNSFGLFVLPVSSEYQLSRANMNTAMILLNVGVALVSPILGRMLDRFPAQWIMWGCAGLLGSSFAALGVSRSIGVSAVVLALPLAIGIQGAGSLTVTVLIARWFTAQRGRAMAISVIGMSLGSVLTVAAVGSLMERYGWRTALLLTGAIIAVVLAAMACFVRERPGPDDHEGAAGARTSLPAGVPMSVREILKMTQFWTIALGTGLALAVAQALVITLVPFVREAGMTMGETTRIVSFMGGAAIVSKLALTVVADKVDRVSLLAAMFVLGAILNVVLLVSEGYVMFAVSAAMLGTSVGAISPLMYALLADRFGAVSFGTVRGLTIPVAGILSAAALRVAGEIFDRTGAYDLLFASFVAVQVVAVGVIFATRFTKPVVNG